MSVPAPLGGLRLLLGVRVISTPTYGECEPPGEKEHDQRTDDSREPAGQPGVVDTLGGVVSEGAALCLRVLGSVEEARLLCDVLQAVRVSGCVEADPSCQEERDRDAHDQERPGPHAGAPLGSVSYTHLTLPT